MSIRTGSSASFVDGVSGLVREAYSKCPRLSTCVKAWRNGKKSKSGKNENRYILVNVLYSMFPDPPPDAKKDDKGLLRQCCKKKKEGQRFWRLRR